MIQPLRGRRLLRACAQALALLLILAVSRARAQNATDDAPALREADSAAELGQQPAHRPLWCAPPWLATTIAIVPGLVLHGAGSFCRGQRATAQRLLLAELAGLGAFLAAGSALAVTGGSRRLVNPLAPLILGGFGVFALSWLSDIYAASTGGRDAQAATLRPLSAEVGYLYVHDPQFRYGSFLFARSDLRANRLRVTPTAWVALSDDNQRFLLELAYRAWGRVPGQMRGDGSYLELSMGAHYRRFASDGFAVIVPEWQLLGRYDLARVGPALSGAFVEGGLGAGLELYDFDAPDSRLGDNASGLLLARFGFGVYFGQGGARSGEALLYYDHRHDDYAAGLGVQGIGSGVLGHCGLSGHYFANQQWGVGALAELGSAYVAGVSLRYRQPPQEEIVP